MNAGGQRTMRTAAWYGDRPLTLALPDPWHVTTHWPATPAPLTDDELAAELEHPIEQLPVRELCRGKQRPLIIVDDLNRPTPAERIIPIVLRHLEEAGVPSEAVTVLIATGTHGAPGMDGVAKKIGPDAAARCRLLVHDSRARTTRIGTTSAGTPIFVNPAVLASDFIIGIGGVYPNYTAGFGGGAKLALGVLGRRSIQHLHYSHKSMGGVYDADNSFRRDIAEIASRIGLNTTISVHVNEARDIVRVISGDHRVYYPDAVAFSLNAYEATGPGDADIVISNTYPEDLSLLFARMKGFVPLRRAKPGASLVAIAHCNEGIGHHGLFPELVRTRKTALRDLIRRLRVLSLSEISAKLGQRLVSKPPTAGQKNDPDSPAANSAQLNPMWVYVTGPATDLPTTLPGLRVTRDWSEIIAAIHREQHGREGLRAVIYPCAPLQCVAQTHRTTTYSLPLESAAVR